MRQAIIYTNADQIHWRIYAALEGDELMSKQDFWERTQKNESSKKKKKNAIIVFLLAVLISGCHGHPSLTMSWLNKHPCQSVFAENSVEAHVYTSSTQSRHNNQLQKYIWFRYR